MSDDAGDSSSTDNEEKDNRWTCYLLKLEKGGNATYVGKTTNFENRLRKHNGEISGGARTTRIQRVKHNTVWIPVLRIINLSKHEAGSLETHWHNMRRNKKKNRRFSLININFNFNVNIQKTVQLAIRQLCCIVRNVAKFSPPARSATLEIEWDLESSRPADFSL
jgi:predicted GIY-YIG superfamily endonuclease